jgi:phage terminase small subunit
MSDEVRPLTEQEQRFFEVYCRTASAKEAALRAGLTDDPDKASRYAAKMLKQPHMQRALLQASRNQAAAQEVTAERIVRELAAIGFSKVSDYLQPDETNSERLFRIRNLDDIDAFQMAAVRKITERTSDKGLETSIEMHAKLPALEKLIKIIGLDKGLSPSGVDDVGNPDVAAEATRLYEAMKGGQER